MVAVGRMTLMWKAILLDVRRGGGGGGLEAPLNLDSFGVALTQCRVFLCVGRRIPSLIFVAGSQSGREGVS